MCWNKITFEDSMVHLHSHQLKALQFNGLYINTINNIIH